MQKGNKIEGIVVDVQSTDTTLSTPRSYPSKLSLKILQLERARNWVKKTNYALSNAQGEYFCSLHHDEIWLKDRLSTMKLYRRKVDYQD
jgi:glycosyltransferase involved in cell wall biosynthesis